MNNGDFNNQWRTNYGANNWQNQSISNVYLVTGLEEALMRTTQRNSDVVYFNQDKPIFYRIKVDLDGRKVWQEFNYVVPNPDNNIPATKADLNNIFVRLEKLENLINMHQEVQSSEVNHE